MIVASHRRTWRERVLVSLLLVTLMPFAAPVSFAMPNHDNDKDHDKNHQETETPIKHVIVLIGENRTFDHLFATYVPKSRDSVKNLLSEGIIKATERPERISGRPRNFRRSLRSRRSFTSASTATTRRLTRLFPSRHSIFRPVLRRASRLRFPPELRSLFWEPLSRRSKPAISNC